MWKLVIVLLLWNSQLTGVFPFSEESPFNIDDGGMELHEKEDAEKDGVEDKQGAEGMEEDQPGEENDQEPKTEAEEKEGGDKSEKDESADGEEEEENEEKRQESGRDEETTVPNHKGNEPKVCM